MYVIYVKKTSRTYGPFDTEDQAINYAKMYFWGYEIRQLIEPQGEEKAA